MNSKNIKYIALLFCASSLCTHIQASYTLEECKSMALEQNINIKKADNNIESAQQTRKEAFTKYFPSVSATGAYFNANHEILNKSLSTGGLLPAEMSGMLPASIPLSLIEDGTLAGATAVQPIFAGGQIVNNNKLAKLAIHVNELQKQQTEKEVSLTSEMYYWQLISLKEKLNTATSVEEMLKKLNSEVQKTVDAGVITRNDLLQVELKQNDMESAIIKLKNGIQLSKMVLAQYMGIEYSDSFDIAVENIIDSLPASPSDLYRDHQEALSGTQEYQLLEENVNAKTLIKKLETGKHLPSVAVGAGYLYSDLSDFDKSFGVVFATVSVPISDWWGGSHGIKRQKIELKNAEMDLENASELLIIKMQKTWNELDDAYKQIVIARKSIEQASENLRLNNDYYKVGITNMSDLLTAQSMYQQCKDKYIDAFSQYQIKRLEYLQAVGE